MCPVLGHWTPPVQSLGWPPWTLVTPSHTCAGLLLGGGRCFKPKTSGKTVLSYHTMKYKFNCISLVKFINFRVWYDNNEDFHAWGAVRFFLAVVTTNIPRYRQIFETSSSSDSVAQRLHCTYARAPPEVSAPERMLRCLYDFGYKSHNLLKVAPIHIYASSGQCLINLFLHPCEHNCWYDQPCDSVHFLVFMAWSPWRQEAWPLASPTSGQVKYTVTLRIDAWVACAPHKIREQQPLVYTTTSIRFAASFCLQPIVFFSPEPV